MFRSTATRKAAFCHGYYRNYCYLPLYIFDGRHLLATKLRRAVIDAAAGAEAEIARIVEHVRKAWPEVEIWLRADSGFARDALMTWCKQKKVEFVVGMAKNKRLTAMFTAESAQVKATFEATKTPARVFEDLRYRTLDSWSEERRVVAKAEHIEKGASPGFIVTSLAAETFDGRDLYEKTYCARGEMENRIQECQIDMFADRTSASEVRANRIRLGFASLANVLVDAVRRLGLEGTKPAKAAAGLNRQRLLKLGAVVTRSERRIRAAFATATPAKDAFALAHSPLRSIAA